MPLVSKGGENELRAFHASLHIIYFSYSTSNASCFQGRGEWTNGNSRRPLHYLLLTLNKQRFLFPREERTNWGQSTQDFIFLTSHIQQQRLFVSKGGKSGLTAIHADLYIIYFSFLTNNASCFQGREERTEGNPCRILYSLLHIFNKQRFLFPREGRTNWKQFMRAFTSFTSHSQQTTISCFQERRNCFVSIDMVTWMD